jgi:hypothetical protein
MIKRPCKITGCSESQGAVNINQNNNMTKNVALKQKHESNPNDKKIENKDSTCQAKNKIYSENVTETVNCSTTYINPITCEQ